MYPEIPDEVLAFQDRFTLCVGAGVPDPVRLSDVVAGCALLASVNVPFAVPAVKGLKVIEKGMLSPAGIVTGNVKPPIAKTELLLPAAVTVTLAPLAVSLPDALPLVPTTTLPRFKVVGVTASCPTAVVPVPDNVIARVGFVASEVMVTFPETAPVACGANVTEKLVLCDGVNVSGIVSPAS